MRITNKDLQTALNVLKNRTGRNYAIQTYLGSYRLTLNDSQDVCPLMSCRELYRWINAYMKGMDDKPTKNVIVYFYQSTSGKEIPHAETFETDYQQAAYNTRKNHEGSVTPITRILPPIHKDDDTLATMLQIWLDQTPNTETGLRHSLTHAIQLLKG